MIRDLYRKGLSISEIARLTGHDRKTVRRVVEGDLAPAPRIRQARARKIDPFANYLQQRIDEGVINARKLYGEIKNLGYSGKETQVRSFVQPHRLPRQSQATVRFETAPGEQAQVDWGHFGLIECDGRPRHLYGFVMALGWSRAIYLEFTVSTDIAWFLRCHLHAFRYFGGVPRQVLHDNLKTAVLERDAELGVHWNPRYLDFADHYGFTPRACQPYRAQTKGKVESGIKYVRGNFWPGLTFLDLADLNCQALDWLNQVANVRMHGTTGEVPFARLPLEALTPLPAKPDYNTHLISCRRSSRDCLLSYGGNYYSVPARHAQQPLMVQETEQGELIVLSALGVEIARHRLAIGHGQRIIVSAHYQTLPTTAPAPKRSAAKQILSRETKPLSPEAAPIVEIRPLSAYEQLLQEAA